jgi:hypothetical protein
VHLSFGREDKNFEDDVKEKVFSAFLEFDFHDFLCRLPVLHAFFAANWPNINSPLFARKIFLS